MSKKKNKDIGFSNFGFSTILLAFVMICIVTISAVSLLTANSDYKLSKKVAEKNEAYYIAEETAYNTLAKVDTILADAYQLSSSEDAYYEALETTLSNLGFGTYEKTDTEYIFSYETPISETQNLKVTLTLNYPNSSNDTFYKISSWQSEYEVSTHEEEPLDLFQ